MAVDTFAFVRQHFTALWVEAVHSIGTLLLTDPASDAPFRMPDDFKFRIYLFYRHRGSLPFSVFPARRAENLRSLTGLNRGAAAEADNYRFTASGSPQTVYLRLNDPYGAFLAGYCLLYTSPPQFPVWEGGGPWPVFRCACERLLPSCLHTE